VYRSGRTGYRKASMVLATLLVATATIAVGCRAGIEEPLSDSREALGTIVTITVYGDDQAAMKRYVDRAFDRISDAEAELSAYPDVAANPAAPGKPMPGYEVASVAEFNRDPFEWHKLPPQAATILDRIEGLGVGEFFSPGMLRVVQLYDFEGEGKVPEAEELNRAVRAARAFETSAGSTIGRFAETGELLATPNPPYSSYAAPAAGLDLSGALKGLALDQALDALQKGMTSGKIDGAILSAGSTTIVAGSKPEGESSKMGQPWQVGIEDPETPKRSSASSSTRFPHHRRPDSHPQPSSR